MDNDKLGRILDKLISIESEISDIKTDIRNVDNKVDRLEMKVDRHYNHFLDYEAQNATRHIELREAIEKNRAAVDYLKAVK